MDEGYRVKADGERGADYAFGNVAAITAHASPLPGCRQRQFRLRRQGFRSNSWMPLLLDPRQLPDRTTAHRCRGYADLGFAAHRRRWPRVLVAELAPRICVRT